MEVIQALGLLSFLLSLCFLRSGGEPGSVFIEEAVDFLEKEKPSGYSGGTFDPPDASQPPSIL